MLRRQRSSVAEPAVAIVEGVDRLEPEHGPLFAVIGVFDGIHLGHQYLLRRLVEEARTRSARPAVITFDSHPDEVLVGAAPPLLLDPEERIRLLEEAGVEVIVVQHFDPALRATEYDDFLHRITRRTRLAGLLMSRSGPALIAGQSSALLPWALVTVLVATAEEWILRGVLFDLLDRHAGTLAAVAVTSAIFALMHVPLYGWHVVPLDLGVGLWLGGLRLLTGSVAAPAVAHVLADLATWWL